MGRPTDWWVLDLDGDPTPGDPTRVQELAGRFHGFAGDVSSALRDVKGLEHDSAVQTWTGQSGDAYREQFGDVPGELTKLERSYRMAGDALTTYWPKLQEAQRQADRALEQGRTARQNLTQANGSVGGAEDWVRRANQQAQQYEQAPPGAPPPDPEAVRAATRNAQQAQAQLAQARSAANAAQSQLDAARRLAEQAAQLRDTAANHCVRAIHDASEAGIKNKRWWEKAVDWVADHWDEIVTVCKWIVAIAGIIVLIIGGPLAWLVLAAALVVLADTIMKYAQGKASGWDLLFAALDCIPGMKGLTSVAKLGMLWKAGGLRSLGKAGLTALRGGLRNMATTLRGLGAAGKTIIKDLPGALGDLVQVGARVTPEGMVFPHLSGSLDGFRMMMSQAGDAFRGGENIRDSLGRLVPVNVRDPQADALAQRIDGEASVKFENGPDNEFDAVSDEYVAQAKPEDFTLNKKFRDQAKVTFETAIATGRTPYFQFEGPPDPDVLRALDRYAERYGVQPVIDIDPVL